MRQFIFVNFDKKHIDLFLCFLFLRIYLNGSNKSITICVYYVELFLNINVSSQYSVQNTHAGKLLPLLSTYSMQTCTYYVQTKSYLGRTMFAMIIVYINNVMVMSCLSPKPSVMDLYLLFIPIGIHIADL